MWQFTLMLMYENDSWFLAEKKRNKIEAYKINILRKIEGPKLIE